MSPSPRRSRAAARRHVAVVAALVALVSATACDPVAGLAATPPAGRAPDHAPDRVPGLAADRTTDRTTDPAPVDLADGRPFAVLAAGSVTGPGTVTGDVGGSTVVGLTGRVAGAVRTGDTAQPLADLGEAQDDLASRPVTATLTSAPTAGATLGPGVYTVSGPVDLPGALTLDAGGDPDASFVVRTDAGFTTGAATRITLARGARACNVFWLVGGSATIGGTVVGTVVARAGLTGSGGASVTGRLVSPGGAVRLGRATVALPTDCAAAGPR